ncbi:MAG: hypothetical protein Q4G05_03880 [Clostridia bacterium]|nr:hypothetical protein [Clostridia bacterium]
MNNGSLKQETNEIIEEQKTNQNPIKSHKKKTKRKQGNHKMQFLFITIVLLFANILLTAANVVGKNNAIINASKSKVLRIVSTDEVWNLTDNANIFKNENDEGEKIIYPGDSGEYNFIIENATIKSLYYKIRITDKNIHNINIKYRLKLDNVYILGDENTWHSSKDINLKDILALRDSRSHYILEWKWFDDENSEKMLKDGLAIYKVYISVYSSLYEK